MVAHVCRPLCFAEPPQAPRTSSVSISDRIEFRTSMYVNPPLESSSRSPSSPCERTTLMATSRSGPLTSLPRCTTANDPSPTFGPTCRQPGKGHGHISPKTIMGSISTCCNLLAGSSRPVTANLDAQHGAPSPACLQYQVVGALAHRRRLRFRLCLFHLLLCPLQHGRLDVTDQHEEGLQAGGETSEGTR